jgi:hypothetical protein
MTSLSICHVSFTVAEGVLLRAIEQNGVTGKSLECHTSARRQCGTGRTPAIAMIESLLLTRLRVATVFGTQAGNAIPKCQRLQGSFT